MKEIMKDTPLSDNVSSTFYFSSNDSNVQIQGVHDSKGNTVFSGVSRDNSIFKILNVDISPKVYELLKRAINNRTIERNYFRLYSELLDGTITEEEFDKEIEENESEYVISNNIIPSKEELMLALNISDDIKDVKTSEDISSLYSFNSIVVDKLLMNNG